MVMSSSFIGHRRSNARKPRKPRTFDDPLVQEATRSSTCPACHKRILHGEVIVFDFTLRDWVHDGTGCRTNDMVGDPNAPFAVPLTDGTA